MASVAIHMAVAKKINEILKRDERMFMLGNIIPDTGKCVGIERRITHFTNGIDNEPIVEDFLKKYSKLDNDFELGYLTHLITDYLWFSEYIKNFRQEDNLVLKDGEVINISADDYQRLIYNDYTNLNSQIYDYYDIDLSMYYDEYDFPDSKIEEIPKIYYRKMMDRMGLICSNTTKEKEYILSIEKVTHFIEYAAIYTIDYLKNNNII